MDIRHQSNNGVVEVYSKIDKIIKSYVSSLEFKEVENAKKIIEHSKGIFKQVEEKENLIKDYDKQLEEKKIELETETGKKGLIEIEVENSQIKLTELQTEYDNLVINKTNLVIELDKLKLDLVNILKVLEEKNTLVSNKTTELTTVTSSFSVYQKKLVEIELFYKEREQELKDQLNNKMIEIDKDLKLAKENAKREKERLENENKNLSVTNISLDTSVEQKENKVKELTKELEKLVTIKNLLETIQNLLEKKDKYAEDITNLSSRSIELQEQLDELLLSIAEYLEKKDILLKDLDLLEELNEKESKKLVEEKENLNKEQLQFTQDKQVFKSISTSFDDKKKKFDYYKQELEKVVGKAILTQDSLELRNILSLINKL